jgi:hypothetical protein
MLKLNVRKLVKNVTSNRWCNWKGNPIQSIINAGCSIRNSDTEMGNHQESKWKKGHIFRIISYSSLLNY